MILTSLLNPVGTPISGLYPFNVSLSDLLTVTEVFVDATYSTNKGDYELYCVLGQRYGMSIPLSYLLLDTAKPVDGRRSQKLILWFACLKERGLYPRWILSDKDMAEVKASREVWPNANHQLCFWHAHKSIRARVATIPSETKGRKARKPPKRPAKKKAGSSVPDSDDVFSSGRRRPTNKNTGPAKPDSDDEVVLSANDDELDLPVYTDPLDVPGEGRESSEKRLQRGSLPPYLLWLLDDDRFRSFVNSKDLTTSRKAGRLLTPAEYNALKPMIERHFIQHPWVPWQTPEALRDEFDLPEVFPSTLDDFGTLATGGSDPTPRQPRNIRETMHNLFVRELVDWCIRHKVPVTFRYLWSNWYRPRGERTTERWELVALSVKPELPVSITTMRVEAHWKDLKRGFLYGYSRPRLDQLLLVMCGLFWDRLNNRWHKVLKGYERPRHYRTFTEQWNKSAAEINALTRANSVKYRTDVTHWVCGCYNYRRQLRLCKHLIDQCGLPISPKFNLPDPPAWCPDMLQHQLPPIRLYLPLPRFPLVKEMHGVSSDHPPARYQAPRIPQIQMPDESLFYGRHGIPSPIKRPTTPQKSLNAIPATAPAATIDLESIDQAILQASVSTPAEGTEYDLRHQEGNTNTLIDPTKFKHIKMLCKAFLGADNQPRWQMEIMNLMSPRIERAAAALWRNWEGNAVMEAQNEQSIPGVQFAPSTPSHRRC